MGGTSYVYLKSPKDLLRVKKTLESLEGVERVLTREEAVKVFHLMPERIGDLVALGNKKIVFEELSSTREKLPKTYR